MTTATEAPPATRQVTVTIPDETHRRLEAAAENRQIPAHVLLQRLVVETFQ